jgi:hypothetical protein
MQAWEMTQGKVLYRDLDAFVAPGVWFLLAGLFSIVEPTVYATRLVALAGFGFIVATVYRLVARDSSPTYAVGASIALVVAVVWAFPAWTFSFYSPYAILFALLGFERVITWSDSNRRFDLLAAGACFGVSILFKQNYGALATVGGLGAYLALTIGRSDRRFLQSLLRDASSLLLGGLLAAVPLLGYVLYHGVIDEMFHALVIQPFSDFAQHHTIRYLGPGDMLGDTALVGTQRLTYGSYPLHVFLYLWPPLLFATAAILVGNSPRSRGALDRRLAEILLGQSPQPRGALDRRLLATLIFCLILFLGVFPRADSNHLMHVYQPVILLSALVFHRLITGQRSRQIPTLVLTTSFALALSYGLTGAIWYKSLVSGLTTPVAGRGGGVLVDLFTGSMLNEEVELLEKLTQPGEPVLTGPGLAMLNFLANRPMPSKYYNMYAVHIGHDQGRGVVQASRDANVNTAIIEYDNFYSDSEGLRDYAPVLADYLCTEFDIIFSVGQNRNAFLRRRDSIEQKPQRRDLLSDCDDTKYFGGGRMIREHTMFRSMHLRAPVNPDSGLESSVECRLDIPDDARLRFMLDYTRPAEVDDDARLYAEIRVRPVGEDDESEQLIFEHAIIPYAADGWILDGPQEVEVDLSPFAGMSVRLELRSWATGNIRHNAFVVGGLATIWMDPVLVWDEDRPAY